jgi:hypothetical protein
MINRAFALFTVHHTTGTLVAQPIDNDPMTSQAQSDPLPRISTQELETLSFTPGKLKVIVQQVGGYFMPIVYHTALDGDTKLHGIIADGADVLATIALADAVIALKELIGTEHTIVTPENPERRIVH